MKSRFDWITLGDKNTKFYHQKTLIRRKRNNLLSLTKDDGTISWDQTEISDTVFHHFKNIYSYSSSPNHHSFTINTPPVLSDSNITSLLFPPTELEIKTACFQLHPLKTSGEDDLHAIFYHKNWNLVKDQIISNFIRIFSNWSVPASWGNTILCLIPKIKNASKPSHLRPIGLCLTHYRI